MLRTVDEIRRVMRQATYAEEPALEGWAMKDYQRGNELVAKIRELGIPSGSATSLTAVGALAAFTCLHRTEQQSLVRLIQQIAYLWTRFEKKDVTDRRNDAAFDFAQKVSQIDAPLPYI